MFQHDYIARQPVFLIFIAFSFILTLGYFWGRRQNKNIFLSAFNDLVNVVRPDDQTFTTIGGVIGYHANFLITKRGAPISKIDATITLLPRQSLLYFPISRLINRYDRLFLTFYFKKKPPEEGHLIETRFSGFRRSHITNTDHLQKEQIRWGTLDFLLYYEGETVRSQFLRFIDNNPDPGIVRHVAIVPEQKKGFLFMIPRKKRVATCLAPVYRWFLSLAQ